MTFHAAVITPVCGPIDRADATIKSVLSANLSGVDYVVIGDVAELRSRFMGTPRGHAIRWIDSASTDVIELINAGLRQTHAPIVSWLLPGDRHFDDSIAIAVEYLDANQDVDVLYGDCVGIDQAGHAFSKLNASRWARKKLRHECFIRQPAVYIRRGTIDAVGALDPSFGRCADYDLWLRLELHGAAFAYLPRLLACQRVASDNTRLWPDAQHTQREDFESLARVYSRHRIRPRPQFLAQYGVFMAEQCVPAQAGTTAFRNEARRQAFAAASQWGLLGWPHAFLRLLINRHLRHLSSRGSPFQPANIDVSSRAHQPKRLQILRKRITKHVHHAPRPMHVPSEYFDTQPPANPPTVSLVTPSFNQAAYLASTLRSVIDQNYPRLEYFVQDGGSSDGSVDVLRAHGDRLTAWESKSDGGQSQAINLGMRRTTGEIMAYLNSDDLLLPGSLAYVARYFTENPDVDVVYGHRVLIDSQGLEIGRWVLPPHDDSVITYADFIPQETMFWRRRAWDAAGGQIDESFRFAMDWDLILRFREAGMRFVRLPRFLGAFRVTAEQKTSSWGMTVGRRESERLAMRIHGQSPSRREIRKHLRRYMRLHYVYDKLYLTGMIRH